MRSAGRYSAPGGDDDHQALAQRVDALPDHKRALYEALRRRRHTADAAGTGVEILRPGPGDPMVLVHPVGGDVLCYGELVALLPGTYPICGLAADEALRGDRPPSFTSLVTHYMDRLDRAGVQPMLLSGWSFGGMMAYEMARHLAGRRHPVEVVVIDAIPPLGTVRRLSPPELMAAFAVDLVRSAALRPTEINFDPAVWRMPERAALAVLRTEMAAHGIELGLSLDELADRARVYVNGFAALDRHRPAPDGPAVRVLWATGSATDARGWWRDVAAGQVHGIGVPADHYSLLRRPAVIAVAEFLHGAVTATGIPR